MVSLAAGGCTTGGAGADELHAVSIAQHSTILNRDT
jgi:hypothetical protein